MGAWCNKKFGISVLLLVLALLAYKEWESANSNSMNQGSSVTGVSHPVVAELTKEPLEEEGACEEMWSEATEQKANLSSGVDVGGGVDVGEGVGVGVYGSCKPIDEYHNALRWPCRCGGIRLVSPLPPTVPPVLLPPAGLPPEWGPHI